MKKKILCFIFAFIFMFPFTFMLSGCFGENPPSDPPTEQGPDSGNNNGNNNENNGGNNNGNNEPQALTVDTILTAVESVKRENYSFVLGAEYSKKQYEITNGLMGAGQTNGVSVPNIVAKVDGNNAYIKAPDLEGYLINGMSYGVDSKGNIDVNYTNNPNGIVDEDTQILNIVNQFSNAEIFGTFVQTAKIVNKNGITVTEETNQKTVKLDIDLTTFAQKTQTNLKNNRQKTLQTFINQLLTDLSGSPVDIIGILNEFENVYTDQTTVEDLLKFVSQKTGIAFMTILEKVDAITGIYEKIEKETNHEDYRDDYKLNFGNIYGSLWYGNATFTPNLDKQGYTLDSIKSIVLSSLVETEGTNKTAKQIVFETLKECLTDENLTVDVLMQAYFEDSYENNLEILEQIINLDIKQAKLTAEFVFDNSYNFTSIKIGGVFEANNVDNTTKDGVGGKITFDIIVNISNHGTTVVAIPGTAVVDYVDIELYLNSNDIAKLVNSNYTVQLNKLAVNIGSFSINGFKKIPGTTNTYSETATTLVSYNSAVKFLTINNTLLLEAFATQDVNNIEINMYNDDNGDLISYHISVYVI